MLKGSSGLRRTKTGQQSSGIKSFGQTNQSSKSLAQIGESTCGEKMVKELQPPISPTTNHRGGSVMMGVELLSITKLEICTN